MKLTTKGRYAVMAMADLALYADEKPISLSLKKIFEVTNILKKKKIRNFIFYTIEIIIKFLRC